MSSETIQPKEQAVIFTDDGIDIKALAKSLNYLVHISRGKSVQDSKRISIAMASLVAAAGGYDALCAGVNQSIGNAFKEEGQDTVFLNPR